MSGDDTSDTSDTGDTGDGGDGGDTGATPEGEERQWGQRATEHDRAAPDDATGGAAADSGAQTTEDDEWPREATDQ